MPGDCHPMQLFPHGSCPLSVCSDRLLSSSPPFIPSFYSLVRISAFLYCLPAFVPVFLYHFPAFVPVFFLQPPCLRSISARIASFSFSIEDFFILRIQPAVSFFRLSRKNDTPSSSFHGKKSPHNIVSDLYRMILIKFTQRNRKTFLPRYKTAAHTAAIPIHSPAYRRTPSKFPNICRQTGGPPEASA